MKKEKDIFPGHFEKIKEKHPDFIEAVEKLGKVVRKTGPLQEKVSLLVQLAAAVAVRAEGSVHSHTRRALKIGVSPDEIRHAVILLTSTIGFPAVAAALSWVDDVIEG